MAILKVWDGSAWVEVPVGVSDHGALSGLTDDDHTQYLLVAGSRAMTGALAMGSNKITGLANGSASTDALAFGQLTTHKTTDADHTQFLLLDGTRAMTGALDMGTTHKITNLAAATLAGEAVELAQMQAADALRLALAGGTMSGAIAMGSNKITGLAEGTAAGDAVRLEQLHTVVVFHHSGTGASTSDVLDVGGVSTDFSLGIPLIFSRAKKLGNIAVNAWSSDSAPADWTCRLRLNGSGSDTATFAFSFSGASAATTQTSGAWDTGDGASIAADDEIEVRVDGASTNDVWVSVTIEFDDI